MEPVTHARPSVVGRTLRRADYDERGPQPALDQPIDIDAADEGKAPIASSMASTQCQQRLPTGSLSLSLVRSAAATAGGTHVGGQLVERVARRQRQYRVQNDGDPEILGLPIKMRHMRY